MSEWWTYGLRDLLLFSPRTYWRLFELYNTELWPLHLPALALGVGIVVLLVRPGENANGSRAAALMLSACWLWVAWAFHWQRYAGINWAASWFAGAFAVEAMLLLWLGVARDRQPVGEVFGIRRRLGLAIFGFALLAYPLIGSMLGRSWSQVESFGMAPDPTALATIGFLLLVGGRAVWALMPIPLAWCLVSGATLWAMAAKT